MIDPEVCLVTLMAEGRKRAVAALLREAATADGDADRLEAGGHGRRGAVRRAAAVRSRALAFQVGHPTT